MFRFIIRRVLISIPMLVLASFLCFALTTAMGDPLGDWKTAKPRTQASWSTWNRRESLPVYIARCAIIACP